MGTCSSALVTGHKECNARRGYLMRHLYTLFSPHDEMLLVRSHSAILSSSVRVLSLYGFPYASFALLNGKLVGVSRLIFGGDVLNWPARRAFEQIISGELSYVE